MLSMGASLLDLLLKNKEELVGAVTVRAVFAAVTAIWTLREVRNVSSRVPNARV